MGVSGDAPAGLKVFYQTHQLNFDLLSDYNGMIAKAFGVPMRDGGVIERTFLGKPVSLERGVTASRWTFIIGKDGKVMHKNTQVNAAQDRTDRHVLVNLKTLPIRQHGCLVHVHHLHEEGCHRRRCGWITCRV